MSGISGADLGEVADLDFGDLGEGFAWGWAGTATARTRRTGKNLRIDASNPLDMFRCSKLRFGFWREETKPNSHVEYF